MKKTANIQGFKINLLKYAEALDFVKESLDNGENIQIVTINPEMIMSAKKNPEFKDVLKYSELVIPDGVGIKIALKLKGINQEQIRGVEFARSLVELASKYGYKLAIVGAKSEINEKLVVKLKEQYPNLNIVYNRDGYFTNDDEVIQEIKNSGANLVFSALGAPKQELFNAKLKNALQGVAAIGLGGTFDVLTGSVEEAPSIYRKLGLEWLYRTVKQPERFKRIFPTLPLFLFHSIMDVVKDNTKNNLVKSRLFYRFREMN